MENSLWNPCERLCGKAWTEPPPSKSCSRRIPRKPRLSSWRVSTRHAGSWISHLSVIDFNNENGSDSIEDKESENDHVNKVKETDKDHINKVDITDGVAHPLFLTFPKLPWFKTWLSFLSTKILLLILRNLNGSIWKGDNIIPKPVKMLHEEQK